MLAVYFTGPQSLSYDLEYRPLHLVGFDICYSWRTKEKYLSSESGVQEEGTTVDPFSQNLPLPYLTIVNETVERFITFQIVKLVFVSFAPVIIDRSVMLRRYPLIFGTWHKVLSYHGRINFSLDDTHVTNSNSP